MLTIEIRNQVKINKIIVGQVLRKSELRRSSFMNTNKLIKTQIKKSPQSCSKTTDIKQEIFKCFRKLLATA